MQVNYSNLPVIHGIKSIFLAGPTPRINEVQSWRPSALKILEEIGFDGIVYVPEREIDNHDYDLVKQADWEREALFSTSKIAFWIPRDLETMPAFTTNVEFGYWMAKDKNKVFYGRPNYSRKHRYLDWLYNVELNKQPFDNLKDLLSATVQAL